MSAQGSWARCRRRVGRLSTVKWLGRRFGESSSQPKRGGHGRAGPRTWRVGCDGGRPSSVAQVVDVDPALALAELRRSPRIARGVSRAIASASPWAKRLTSSHSALGVSGTTTCSPLPPVVLTKLSSPSARSRSRTSHAPSIRAVQATSSPGSRSIVIRSGRSGLPIVDPQGWISSTPACTRATRPSRSR